MVGYTTLTVSVPEGKEGDLLRYAASLAGGTPSEDDDFIEDDDQPEPANGRRRWGTGRRAVRDAYLGGVSDVWRPFLEYLADNAGEWVSWPELCEHIDRTPREASGMLGAAERRCNGRPPYEKAWQGRVRHFRMEPNVAEIINELRGT
jgi:hypothetical protein